MNYDIHPWTVWMRSNPFTAPLATPQELPRTSQAALLCLFYFFLFLLSDGLAQTNSADWWHWINVALIGTFVLVSGLLLLGMLLINVLCAYGRLRGVRDLRGVPLLPYAPEVVFLAWGTAFVAGTRSPALNWAVLLAWLLFFLVGWFLAVKRRLRPSSSAARTDAAGPS